jgi:hypothetical protein
MTLRAILESHYARTVAALDRSERFSAENESDCEACDNAGIHLQLFDEANARTPRATFAIYAPIKMRRRESAAGPWTLFDHVIAASEACGRAITCNGHAADLRAYNVARHYAKALGR